MKKTYLSALVIGLTSVVGFSQSAQKTIMKRNVSTDQPISAPTTYTEKVLGQEIWIDDFSTPSNWTIDNDGQPTTGNFGWNINATKESWTFGTINMTGNYAELGNGVPTPAPGTQALGVEYTMTTGPLDVPALAFAQTGVSTSEVILEFKEYGAKFNDDQRVQISTDGTTFTTIRDNSEYEALTDQGGAAYPNPATVTVNIAPYISGNPTNVYIRFSWTSIAPASTNPNAWVAYGWFIDDVRLLTKPTNDIVAKPYFWGVEGEIALNTYYQTPTTQIAPIYFSAIGVNDGATPQTNVTLNVDVASGTFTGTSPAGLTIAPNAQDTAEVSTTFTPPASVASYPVTWNLSQTEVDDIIANNTLPGFTFEVTDNIYAADNGTATGNIYNQGLAYEIGAWFDIFNSQDLYGIDVKLNSATVNGTIVRGVLYEVNVVNNALEYNEVSSSNYHDIVAADKIGFLTLELLSPYTLQANQTYMVTVETDGDGGAGDDLVVSLAQPTENFIGFQDENGDWYTGFLGGTNAPMVRMNFDQTLGLNESAAVNGLGVYPNPATDNISVDFNLANASDVTIEVVDAAGQVVITKALASQAAGATNVSLNTNALNSGVYFVNISTEAGKATEKFIKK